MFDKNDDKNQRQPITDDNSKGGKQIRPTLNAKYILDSEIYEQIHKDKKLMKINEINGEVQHWLDRGAEPVPVQHEQRKVYKGLNDKKESEWVCWPGGTHDGTPFKVYLLMIDPELYAHYKTEPERKRQADIRAAMYRGEGTENDAQTYAPNLPDGSGRGFNTIRQNSTQPVDRD
jgi:hypothetical protein